MPHLQMHVYPLVGGDGGEQRRVHQGAVDIHTLPPNPKVAASHNKIVTCAMSVLVGATVPRARAVQYANCSTLLHTAPHYFTLLHTTSHYFTL
eukprot:2468628-Pyramimonas_sp.AAC.2